MTKLWIPLLVALVACADISGLQTKPALFDVDCGAEPEHPECTLPVISTYVASNPNQLAKVIYLYAWTSGTAIASETRVIYADGIEVVFDTSVDGSYMEAGLTLEGEWPCRIVWKAWGTANCQGCVTQVDSLVLH